MQIRDENTPVIINTVMIIVQGIDGEKWGEDREEIERRWMEEGEV